MKLLRKLSKLLSGLRWVQLIPPPMWGILFGLVLSVAGIAGVRKLVAEHNYRKNIKTGKKSYAECIKNAKGEEVFSCYKHLKEDT